MLKEILSTATAVALGIIIASVITKKILKTSSWEEWDDEDEWEED